MWICPKCGSQCDAEFCSNCGAPRGSDTSGARSTSGFATARAAGSTNRMVDIMIAALMLIGIILLLFTPMVSGDFYGSSFSYNLQDFYRQISEIEEQLQPYVGLSSDVSQTMPRIEAISSTTLAAIVFLYACALLTIINFFKAMPRVFSATRWIALATGAGLLVSMTSAESKIEESDLIASFFSTNVRIGYIGIVLGILMIAAAMVLHAKPELLSGLSFLKLEETSGLKWKCPNPSCGHMNSAGNQFCAICGTKKVEETVPEGTWKCPNSSCGHMNSEDSRFCTLCGTKKAEETVVKSAWKCPNSSCGHMNSEDSRFCSACGTEKNTVVVKPRNVWICCSCGKENNESAAVCAYCHKPKNGVGSDLFERNPEF